MSAYNPAWRLRGYAPRSVDATEQTVLTPAAGAPHSQRFQYATVGSLRANLLDNPQLDTVLSGWARVTGFGTVTRDLTNEPFGVATAKMVTSTDATTAEGLEVRMAAGTRVPVSASTPYVGSLYVDFTGATGVSFRARLNWYTSGSVFISSSNANFTTAAGWLRVSVAATSPGTAAFATLSVEEVSASATSRTFYATGAQIEQATALGDYNNSPYPYLGYLQAPRGRQQTIDPLSKKLKGGGLTVRLLDKRVTAGGSNASRHVTAFMGNTADQPLPLGLRVELDFCENIEATVPVWARWYTGRIEDVSAEGGTGMALALVDASRELDAKVFATGRLHSSVAYGVEGQIWPLGLTAAYGPFAASRLMSGTFTAGTGAGAGMGYVALDDGSKAAANNVYASGLQAFGVADRIYELSWSELRFTSVGAVRVKQTSGGASGTVTEYDLGGISVAPASGSSVYRITRLYIRAKAGGGALPSDGVTCEISVRQPDLATTKDRPVLLGDAHPVQLMADALDGKFSPLNTDGSVRRTWPRESTSFAALLADTSLKTLRFPREKPLALNKFLEEVCQQSGLGYYLNASGEVVVVDLRLPTSVAGVQSLSESDLVAAEIPEWSLSRANAITRFSATWYAERNMTSEQLKGLETSQGVATVPFPTLVQAFERPIQVIDFGRLDLGDRDFDLNVTGLRVGQNEMENGVSRELTARGRILALVEEYRAPFGYGPQETTLTCRRTAVPKASTVGQLLLVTADKLPNPGSNQRGGTRLVRVLERNGEDGPTIRLTVLDLGPNVVLVAPTLGVITQETGNTTGGVTFSVTENAQGDPITVQIAVTDTSVTLVGNVPEASWLRTYRLDGSQTISVRPLPSAKRIWVRVRSEVGSTSVAKLPSAWAYSSGTDYVDLAALTAPTGLAVSAVSALSATLTFTNPSPTVLVELQLESPSGSGLVPARVYPPGTTKIVLQGTTSGASYGAAVRFLDGSGGGSALSNTVTWTATGTAPVCPVPTVLEIETGLY